jgi:hypothetical protein
MKTIKKHVPRTLLDAVAVGVGEDARAARAVHTRHVGARVVGGAEFVVHHAREAVGHRVNPEEPDPVACKSATKK